MMQRKTIILLFVMLIASHLMSQDIFAAWTQPKGHAYNQLTFGYYVSDHKFSSLERDGNIVIGAGDEDDVEYLEASKFSAVSVTYYGEYGWTDTLTVFTAIPWKMLRSQDVQDYYDDKDGPSGLGDIDLGVRYKLSDKLLGTDWLMSAEGKVKIPEAYDYGYPLEYLSLGDGQYDTTLSLVFGKAVANGKGYVVINGGYKYRFENSEYEPQTFKPSDQITAFISGGYSIKPKVQLRGTINWNRSVGNAEVSDEILEKSHKYGVLPKADEVALVKDTLTLEQNTLNVGVGLSYSMAPKMQVVVSYNRDIAGAWIFETNYAGKGETYNLALVYMF